MASKGKSNSDDRHTRIIDKICELHDKDSENRDFFKLLETEKPKFIEVEENGEKKNKAVSQEKPYISKNSPGFQEYQNFANTASISNQIYYPDEVESSLRQVYGNSTENIEVYLGFFPQAGFFYCINGNLLFLFSKPKRDNNNNISFDKSIIDVEDQIRSCDIDRPDPNIYDENVVGYILYIATQNSIIIYPVGKTCDKIFESKKITKSTSFIPTCIKAYHTDVSYSVFIGSNSGDIYGLFSQLDPNKATIEVKIKPLSSYLLLSIAHTFLFTNAIIFLAYDTTTSYLASVDSKSNITFYKFDSENRTLKKVSTYEPQTEDPYPGKIVSINEIPISDSETTRFVCITEFGYRLFFGTNQAIYLDDRIERFQKLYIPENLAINNPVNYHSGCFYLSNSFFVSSNSLVVMRPCYLPHKPILSPPEIYEIFDQIGEDNHALSLVVPDHPYKNQPITLFYHDLLWQHIMPPPVCYLLCTNGFYEITLKRPVDKLNELITNTNEFTQGIFADPTRKWMSYFSDEAESAATAVLLASEVTTLLPDGKINESKKQQNIMKILYHFSDLSKKMITPTMQQNGNLSKASAGFAQRAARLLSVIWDVPVLIKDTQNKYCLSPIFSELPPRLKDEIKKLILLTEEYKKNRYTALDTGSNPSRERKEEMDENKFFEQLTLFLNDVIEMIQFIKIVISHAKIIDKAMQNMDQEDTKQRLLDVFGSQVHTISLFDALRDLAAALLREDPNIFSEFSEECPSFFSGEDKKVIEETNKLKSYVLKCVKPSQSSLNVALKTYLKYIQRPFKLGPIVEIFKIWDFKEGIIKLCLQRAHILDLEGKALQWFKGNRSTDDEDGRIPFDKRYRCYEFIFDLAYDMHDKKETINEENLNEMLKSTDELFHLLLYDWFIRKNHIDDLLDLKTPFIENFLKENLPDSIWIYNSRNGKYTESAIQLLEIIKKKENKKKLSDRYDYIKNAKKLSQASNNKELVNEVTKLEKYCLIQRDLLNRMENEGLQYDPSKGEYLMEPQELFQECCEYDYWDFVLKILSMSGLESKQNEASRKTIISKVWSNYFNVQLWNQDLNTVREIIKNTCRSIDKGSDVIDPAITMPVFEEYRLEKNIDDPIWAALVMVDNEFNSSAILKAYLNAYDKLPSDCDKNIRLGFIYCIFYLATDTDANLNGTNFDPFTKELSLQSDNPFKQNAESLLENWRKCYTIISEMQRRFLEVFHDIPDPNQLNRILDNVQTLHNEKLNHLIKEFRENSGQANQPIASTHLFKIFEGTFRNMFSPGTNGSKRIPKTIDLYQFLHTNWDVFQPVFIQNPLLFQKQKKQ